MDFGHDVIPDAVAQGVAGVWRMPAGPSGRGYWRDVGTLDALRRAQLDFVSAEPARLPFASPASDWYLDAAASPCRAPWCPKAPA